MTRRFWSSLRRWCGWWLMVLLPAVAAASLDERLYEVVVPVADHTAASRNAAVQRGLSEVLVRVSGDPGIGAGRQGRDIVARAELLLRRYQIQPAANQTDAGMNGLSLVAQFDPDAVEQTLAEHGISLWRTRRPLLLAWVGIEAPAGISLLGEAGEEPAAADFSRAAAFRGLPVLLPLWDLEDRSQLRLSDLGGVSLDRMLRASERYAVDGILTGRIRGDHDGGWSARWALWYQGRLRRWTVPPGSLAEAFAGGIGPVADQLVAEALVRADSGLQQQLALTVEGIGSSADYHRVARYLESLDAVRTVQVTGVQDSVMQLSIDLRGDPGLFRRALVQGNVLEPMAGTLDSRYRLRP